MTPRLKNWKIFTLIGIFTVLFILPLTVDSAKKTDLIKNGKVLKPRQAAIKPNKTIVPSGTNISGVIVKFKDDYKVRKRADKLISKAGFNVNQADEKLRFHYNSSFRRLFTGFSEEKLDRKKEVLEARSRQQLADLNSYYKIEISNALEAENLINDLNALEYVEIAYFEPMPELADDISPTTPDYQPNQDYREAAPAGVDADYANTLPGGDGTGVKIIDIEGGWQTTHEDLDKAANGLIAGTMINDPSWRNHGTAVIGVMIAGDNGYGVTGICPGSDIGMISIGTMATSEALITATENLVQGDLILIELHAPGPHYNFQTRSDQLGYVCMEYWQANYDAILYAWAHGIVVIEAGGNGGENYDDPALYGDLFDTTYRNSHAIIVGAGYPAASSSNLQKHGFSNYGERVNLQGYGSGVYTTGYGALFDGGGDENQYYTNSFGGTSSASPIITGTAACLQGYYKAAYGVPLTSDLIRDYLVATGTAQLGDVSKHIGPRPNLLAAIPAAVPPPSIYTDILVIDTVLDEGNSAVFDLWIKNRSNSLPYDFAITALDSIDKAVSPDWLTVFPTSGIVNQADSFLIEVTLDASVLGDRIESYKGSIDIAWGQVGNLDSEFSVLTFLQVPCYDTTYRGVLSTEPDGPTYNWMSAKDNGFKIPFSTFYNSSGGNPLDDGSAGPITTSFDFEFYGQIFTQVYIGVNGGISFTDANVNSNGYYGNFDLPGAPFNSFISAYWSDLVFDTNLVADAGLYIWKKSDTMVIEWYRPTNFNQYGDSTLNFEIILTKDKGILFQYQNIGSSSLEQSVLIGLSAIDCEAYSYFDNGDIPEHIVSDESSIKFTSTLGMWVQSGDLNDDEEIGISDLTSLVTYLFDNGPVPDPYQSGDVNCSEFIDISDITFFVEYMFNNGDEPCSFWYVN